MGERSGDLAIETITWLLQKKKKETIFGNTRCCQIEIKMGVINNIHRTLAIIWLSRLRLMSTVIVLAVLYLQKTCTYCMYCIISLLIWYAILQSGSSGQDRTDYLVDDCLWNQFFRCCRYDSTGYQPLLFDQLETGSYRSSRQGLPFLRQL